MMRLETKNNWNQSFPNFHIASLTYVAIFVMESNKYNHATQRR